MKVLAVGAAGASAGLVTRALSAKGVEARGLVHSAQRAAVAREKGAAETVVADLDDKDALAAALDGVDSQGVITGPYSADSKMTYVDYRDVAEAAALALTTDRLLGGTFELAAAGEFSRHDIARELSRLLGREVRAQGAEPAGLDPPMPAPLREGLQRMFHHYQVAGQRGGNSLVLDTILQRPATNVPAYLRELVTGS